MLRLCGTHQPIRPSRKTIRLTHAETHVTPGARMLAKRQAREPHGCWLGYLMSLMTSDIWLVSRRTIISIRILLFIIVNPILATHQKKGLKNNPESEYTSTPQQHSSTLNPYSVGSPSESDLVPRQWRMWLQACYLTDPWNSNVNVNHVIHQTCFDSPT